MKRTFASIALLVLVSVAAMAQTTTAPVSTPPPANPLATATGVKVAVIDMQGAILGSNEGQRDMEALGKKFEPRRQELQRQSTEVEDLKKQLNTQGDKMSPEAHDSLVKSIESKQKSLQRQAEDFQNEAQQAQSELMQRILQKMGTVITKYVADNGYGLLLDASAPWPQGPVVLFTPPMDITKNVVDVYNAQSGVAAPARTGSTTGTTPKPATPAASKPAATTTPAPAKPASTTPKPN
jgi:outer membrane protein